MIVSSLSRTQLHRLHGMLHAERHDHVVACTWACRGHVHAHTHTHLARCFSRSQRIDVGRFVGAKLRPALDEADTIPNHCVLAHSDMR
jgi:hypothetical protein